jgi:general nucleoside transport system ATP-binding protein
MLHQSKKTVAKEPTAATVAPLPLTVEMRHISKSFPGIKANDDISLELKKGEIHALLGENGAGKSTLMSILFGLYAPDEGQIFVNGQEAHIKNPNDATKLGIGMVHQHFMLVDCFTGLENIILGAEPVDRLGVLHPKKVRQEIEGLCEHYHFTVDLDQKVQDMPVGMQQKVEILKMLFRKTEILIFDEPTAVLTPQEIDELMNSFRELVKEGKTILFISHKLNEIMGVADRVTVLRKGKVVNTVNVKDTNVQELSRMMVGRDVQLVVQKKPCEPKKTVLSVRDLCVYSHAKRKDVVKNVSFDVREGEITCIAGIEGNGQTELIYALTGLEKARSGKIYLRNVSEDGTDIELEHFSVRKRNESGVAHIPEDRHRYGLILDFDLQSNMVLERYYEKPFSHLGWINRQAIRSYSDKIVEQYDVRSGQGSSSIVRDMSGGNQQKAIVGRELDRRTPLLIACQPTRGLDVGAIEYIHKQIVKARDENKGVLLLSLELEEVMNLSDRILVMYEGEIVADLNPKEITLQELGLYMSGAKKMELPPLPEVVKSVPAAKTVLDDAVAEEKDAAIAEKANPESSETKPDAAAESIVEEKPAPEENAYQSFGVEVKEDREKAVSLKEEKSEPVSDSKKKVVDSKPVKGPNKDAPKKTATKGEK